MGKVGEGFKIAMIVLDGARIGIGGRRWNCSGRLRESAPYGIVREQFGKPLRRKGCSVHVGGYGIQIEAARIWFIMRQL